MTSLSNQYRIFTAWLLKLPVWINTAQIRQRLITAVIISLALVSLPTTAQAAAKAGTTCTKVGSTSTVSGKKYTCIKSGTKLIWNKGVVVKVAKPKPVAVKLSNDASLLNIESSALFTTDFSSDIYNYTATVPVTTTNLTLTPIASESNATVKINGFTIKSVDGRTPISIGLALGVNTITVEVVAQDRTTTLRYIVVITRANSGKAITAFSFAGLSPAVTGVISESAKTIALTVPYGTVVTALVSSFTLSTGATVKIGATSQASDVTANNFTTAKSYIITAQDLTTQSYVVTVTVAAGSTTKAITAFSFSGLSPAVTGVIDESAKTIALTVPYGTDTSTLVASFTLSSGATAKIGATSQVSGTTANNFATAKTYIITAQDLTTQSYVVTVTVAAGSTTKAITAFSFSGLSPAVTGVIDESAKTIALTVPYGTDTSTLVASFTLSSGATAKIGATSQVSGTTANNFATAKTYIITAQDLTTQSYVVTVTVTAGLTGKAITSFAFAGISETATVNNLADTGTISITVPAATDTSTLVATFTLSSGATAMIRDGDSGGAPQVSGLTPNNFTTAKTYTITAQDLSTKNYVVSITPLTALTPTFDTLTATATGFTFVITNYNPLWSYAASTSNGGLINIDTATATTLVSISGLGANISDTATITTSRPGYSSGSDTKTATSLAAALTPTFDTLTATATGFTFIITNFNNLWNWTGSITSGSITIDTPTVTATVTGLTPGVLATATIGNTRSGYVAASETITSTTGNYAIGNRGPGGGFIYYVDTATGFSCGANFTNTGSPTGGLCHYLEIAPDTWTARSTPEFYTTWSLDGDPNNVDTNSATAYFDFPGIANETSTANAYLYSGGIGRGYLNSDTITARNTNPYTNIYQVTYGAAKARAYRGGALSDWYIPTLTELNLLCQALNSITQVVGTPCTGDPDTSVAFVNNFINFGITPTYILWSSSEADQSLGWSQNILTGAIAAKSKYLNYSIRPIRAF